MYTHTHTHIMCTRQSTDIVNAILEGYPKSKKELYVSQYAITQSPQSVIHTHTVVCRRRLALRLMKTMVLNYQHLNLTTCTLSLSPISLSSPCGLTYQLHTYIPLAPHMYYISILEFN